MANATVEPLGSPKILIAPDHLLITAFAEHDPDVVRVVGESDRPELAVHNLLVIGAHATLGASMQLDARIVEERFEDMTENFGERVQAAVTTITDTAEQLLDAESGALPQVLASLKKDIEGILEETFDEDSKSSVIAKIESTMAEATEQLDRKVRQALDPAFPESPLSRTRQDILDVVKEQSANVMKEVRDLSLMMTRTTALVDALDKASLKGFAFETVVGNALGGIAAIHGDIVEHVGSTTGGSGTKKGDLLVTLSAEDTLGDSIRFVVEGKDRDLSMTKTLAELDKALENHAASAAMAVFSHAELSPVPVPFWWSGNRAIVTYDKEDPDPRVLQLGYAWARWIARRSMAVSTESELDVGRMEAALTRARQAISRHQTIKSCHSAARKKIDEAGAHVSTVISDVDEAIREVWEILNVTKT
jgi:hypothetical protein